jgi:hypothetical protein
MAITPKQILVFRLSCWFMGLVALSQLIVSGVALAMRIESSREVKVVEKIVALAVEPKSPKLTPAPELTPAPVPAPAPRVFVPETQEPQDVVTIPLPVARPLDTPPIADPIAERLVNEARSARIAEDMISAITKLEDVLRTNPTEPNALFELGLCHEAMGIYDRARAYYHKVKELGTSGAGTLFLKASDKLIAGFEQPQDKINRIVLGRANVFRDPNIEEGSKVSITIPVQCVPGEQIEGRDLEVKVTFFDMLGAKKEIVEADTNSCKIEYKWITDPLDWASGEERLLVHYTIPPQDVQQEHLFGDKQYYGQVVELTYKGELIDAQAWPRILAHKMNRADATPFINDQEMPSGYNPVNPLLPNIDPTAGDPLTLPSYDGPPPGNGDALPPLPGDLPEPPQDLPPVDGNPLPVPAEYQNLGQ